MADYYNKPTAITQLLNSTLRQFASIGLSPRDTVVVQVRGRKSGNMRSNVVTYVEHDGTRYLVAPRGTTEWVRNVRAAGGEASLKHGRSLPVRLIEVPEPERVLEHWLAGRRVLALARPPEALRG
jgi:deazaflavin-dependent oxidoreductase (nitroreductase family)